MYNHGEWAKIEKDEKPPIPLYCGECGAHLVRRSTKVKDEMRWTIKYICPACEWEVKR